MSFAKHIKISVAGHEDQHDLDKKDIQAIKERRREKNDSDVEINAKVISNVVKQEIKENKEQ